MRKFWQIDGIDVRVPLMIIIALGLMAGMQVGGDPVGLSASSTSGSAIVGPASVIDGDTIEIHGSRIRFDGIDAPELGQTCRSNGRDLPCSRQAAFHLADRIGRRPVSCEPQGTDRYGRTLAICLEGGEDLNGMMVRDGQAVAYRRYSDRYVATENEARRAGRGVWATEFEMPWDWRHRQ